MTLRKYFFPVLASLSISLNGCIKRREVNFQDYTFLQKTVSELAFGKAFEFMGQGRSNLKFKLYSLALKSADSTAYYYDLYERTCLEPPLLAPESLGNVVGNANIYLFLAFCTQETALEKY